MSFFFIQNDNAESFQAAIILRCLIRQALTVSTLPKDIEDQLQHYLENRFLDMDDLLSLMKSLSDKSLIHFLVLDGLDECPKLERDIILAVMKVLMSSTGSNIKVFISSRQEIGRELDSSFGSYYHRTMSCSEVHADIANYIKLAIEEKVMKDELHVGDPELLSKIAEILRNEAHGMLVCKNLVKRNSLLSTPSLLTRLSRAAL